jgi:hypothetical protein
LRKTPYALCRSCTGMLDLQISYSNLGALQFNFLEKQQLNKATPECFHAGTRSCATSRAGSCQTTHPHPWLGPDTETGYRPLDRALSTMDPCRTTFPALSPCATRHAPRAHGWRRADYAAAHPLTSPPYQPCMSPYSTLHVAMLPCSLGIASAADKRRARGVFTRAHAQTAVAPHLLSAQAPWRAPIPEPPPGCRREP